MVGMMEILLTLLDGDDGIGVVGAEFILIVLEGLLGLRFLQSWHRFYLKSDSSLRWLMVHFLSLRR